jgi:hypothetical protein
MAKARTLALALIVILTIATDDLSSAAQTPPPADQPGSISVSIALDQYQVPKGQRPLVLLRIKNIGDRSICVSLGLSPYRYQVHVSGQEGEPPQTEYQRHLHGDFRPGDGPDLPITVNACTQIAPPMLNFEGMSVVFKFDLAAYYDLGAPGKYSVYLEVYDPAGSRDGTGSWLRTNTADFEVEAKTK